MSPDGQMVATNAADETIRLWKCFAYDKTKEKKAKPAAASSTSTNLRMCIR
jgi:WD40 repeat protein